MDNSLLAVRDINHKHIVAVEECGNHIMEDSYVLQLQEPKFKEFYLSYSGYAQCGPLHCYGPASRPHYLIHFVLKGKGMYQASGQKHYLTAGQGFLIEPDVQTFYQADKDDPWSYLWIGVGGSNAGKYIRDIGLNSEQLIFRSERGEELKKIVLDMLRHTEMTTANLYYLQGRLYDFFSVLAQDMVIDSYSDILKEKENGYIREAMAFIKNEYASGLGVRELASHLNVNRSYLYTLFMKELNISPSNFIQKYRVTRARELLVLTEFSVEAVGKACGYGNAERFARAFKQETGLSPSQFRRQYRTENRKNLEASKDELEYLINS